MIIVTGSNGFIGSNLIKTLNSLGFKNILAVDDSTLENQINISDCDVEDLISIKEFSKKLNKGTLQKKVDYIFHQGACSDTTEWDCDFLLKNNFYFSKDILEFCLQNTIPLVYASSASVYGNEGNFKEERENERPINLYAYSKYIFDQLVRSNLNKLSSQVVGLRYFNVYGPRESHKKKMASVAFHLHQQLSKGEDIELFGEYDGFKAGKQSRDFIYVDDVIDVNIWFMRNQNASGIFNVGTGKSQTFDEVADAVIKWNKKGKISYIPFPENLKGSYQSYTQADISKLRECGYEKPFRDVQSGVKSYLDNFSIWPKNE
jgi:ADP-L-glycero-D-manno-heptose 6-epimerase